MNLNCLKNGTDIRGVAIGENAKLTNESVKYISRAFTKWVLEKSREINIKIGIGYDSRITSQEIKKHALQGIINENGIAIDCGMASTPAMFMSCVLDETKFSAGIELTASHLPYEYNGMKFFTNKGGIQKSELDEIIDIANNLSDKDDINKDIEVVDIMKLYSNHISKMLINGIGEGNTPFAGLKIIVDAGNGVGGFFASDILKPLGADINGSQFLEPNGMFPNHIPNPENEKAMESIKNAVIKSKADFGIIFDTDCDRAAVVDCNGKEINRNRLIALISTIILKENPGSYIVTDSVTSSGLKVFIESLGGVQHRFKRGYKNVINESIRLNLEGKESHLAIETSGHAAIKENYFLDDGAYLVAKILIELVVQHKQGKNIGDVIMNLQEPLESGEKRFGIKADDFKSYGDMVLEGTKKDIIGVKGFSIEPENYEGIKVNYKENDKEGWFLLRKSLHEPVMPLNIESNWAGGNQFIYEKIDHVLKKYKELEI